jgi:hypothetical protein
MMFGVSEDGGWFHGSWQILTLDVRDMKNET